MTYCVAAAASTGIVFASDSRTHAGTADVSTYGKMTVFEAAGLWTQGRRELCAPAVRWR